MEIVAAKKEDLEIVRKITRSTIYAVKMYENVGFKTVDENDEEYIMVCEL